MPLTILQEMQQSRSSTAAVAVPGVCSEPQYMAAEYSTVMLLLGSMLQEKIRILEGVCLHIVF